MSSAISTLREISEILAEEADPANLLRSVTEVVARGLPADVCSVYLHDGASRELVMRASYGFSEDSVADVRILRLKEDEGLEGLAFTTQAPVTVPIASLDKRYKYLFPQTHEELFASFLAVPLRCGGRPTGVLVVQTREVRHFDRAEIDLVRSIAAAVAPAIEVLRIRALSSQSAEGSESPEVTTRFTEGEFLGLTFKGIGASSGIGLGSAVVRGLCCGDDIREVRASGDVDRESDRFRAALVRTRADHARIAQEAGLRAGSEEAAILEAYSMLLDDESLPERILSHIGQGHQAESAIRIAVEDALAGLEETKDHYLRERSFDIQEVSRRLLDSLRGLPSESALPTEGGPYVLATQSVGLLDLLGPGAKNLSGVVSVEGGIHSHAAIVARSLGIPLVIGVQRIEGKLVEGQTVIVNGSVGLVHVDPPEVVRDAYQKERFGAESAAGARLTDGARHVPRMTITRDGRRITIGANVGLLSHLDAAYRMGAEEIGLYRTELPFLIRRSFPSEEDQVQLYRQAVELMEGRPVTFRTLDVGGDREIPYLTQSGEENPALGWRSIRISLDREDLFRIQLRAILRAGAHGKVKILLPMICRVEEIRRTRAILAEVAEELASQGLAHDPSVPLGAMIEVPAAALIIEKLLREIDFVSVGTNDLTQYTLAVDRNNAKVSSLFDPYHPAILRLIHSVAEHANRIGKPVSICGESASDPWYAGLLVGLGIGSLSVEPTTIPRLQQALGRARFQELEAIAHKILKADGSEALREEAQAHLRAIGFPEPVPSGVPRPPFTAVQYP